MCGNYRRFFQTWTGSPSMYLLNTVAASVSDPLRIRSSESFQFLPGIILTLCFHGIQCAFATVSCVPFDFPQLLFKLFKLEQSYFLLLVQDLGYPLDFLNLVYISFLAVRVCEGVFTHSA